MRNKTLEHELDAAFRRYLEVRQIIREEPPSDLRALQLSTMDKVKNLIVFADARLPTCPQIQEKDIWDIIHRIHDTMDNILTQIKK